ncbi:carbohydrate-binding domain-containing protein [Treponema sp.]|uniref:carbohydrate-binding domain-containing protein n=1 Tax=Treponema sp. TaxID=166 RepID=UPI00257C1014|nr:carbohydrate-binding domain-containing protein [Treponema sp.]MBE6353207.1 carbohydrate-binding domain-containing protein [Treponema sp.]
MKKLFSAAIIFILGTFCFSQDKKNYGEFKIIPSDSSVKIEKNTVSLCPKKEGAEYIISGYFNGQIINKTKNTVLKLNNAFIENTNGQPAVYGEAKTEISSVEKSVNYIIASGSSGSKTAAVQCKKNLEIGGKGTLYVSGKTYHAVKADDVKLKGSGTYHFEGTKDGSAINCKTFTVEKGKTFSAYLSNSKNGIKADKTIFIDSGNFFISNNETAFKTDTKEDDASSVHEIKITGGVFKLQKNNTLFSTEKNGYKKTGGKFLDE